MWNGQFLHILDLTYESNTFGNKFYFINLVLL